MLCVMSRRDLKALSIVMPPHLTDEQTHSCTPHSLSALLNVHSCKSIPFEGTSNKYSSMCFTSPSTQAQMLKKPLSLR